MTTTVAVTETQTETETTVETVAIEGTLPEAVAEKRAAILEAARSGDYDALRPLVADEFSYTFGGPVEGGPVAYWQELERTTDERPLETLARILELPYALDRGLYVWPFAFASEPGPLTEYERDLLGDLATAFDPGIGYLGWRAGIEPDGDWIFFIAGD